MSTTSTTGTCTRPTRGTTTSTACTTPTRNQGTREQNLQARGPARRQDRDHDDRQRIPRDLEEAHAAAGRRRRAAREVRRLYLGTDRARQAPGGRGRCR